MFHKILIANRGEIACRVIRTAKRLGIGTVAVYSDADIGAMHTEMADEAYYIGHAPARESYLCGDLIITAAKISCAEAIHPGYGFLAENAEFAEACNLNDLVFIGPPSSAIKAMGSKSRAKRIMEDAVVPLVPGYHGDEQDPEFLKKEAEKIGFPILIKASAGGGGKGMRVVNASELFLDALSAAKRESKGAFGDDRVLLEKYLTKPRHVEIQVFADSHGNGLYLFERDCSIQRRHQKVLEEAPAPGMTAQLRAKMGAAAVAAAKAIGYVGAGTVEFLLDEDGSFYFMEMNTRLQVEHPVTEMITGQDLVEWQLLAASGEKLPCTQDELSISGHAIEARIYAEDPSRDFLPSIGLLTHLRTPAESRHVRIDTGVRQGDAVSIHYDPMIAKLIVWDTDREGAVRRLAKALSEYRVAGVTTNIGFLSAVADHPAFGQAEIDTGFIERNREGLFPEEAPVSDNLIAFAGLDVLLRRSAETGVSATGSNDPYSPWNRTDGWRMNGDNHHLLTFYDNDREITIIAHYRSDGYLFELPESSIHARGRYEVNGEISAYLDGVRLTATVVRNGNELTVLTDKGARRLTLHDPCALAEEREVEAGNLTAPMPGKIIAVMVEVGAQVKKGTPLLIMEAMKMEHTIIAPLDGEVSRINYSVGAVVNEGAELLVIDSGEEKEQE